MQELEELITERSSRINVLRWFARLWGLVIVAFVGFFLLMHLLGDAGGSNRLRNGFEVLRFLCFPVGLVTGLLLGWKSELAGGLLATGSIAVFYLANTVVLGDAQFDWWISGFAIPGILYLLIWKLNTG